MGQLLFLTLLVSTIAGWIAFWLDLALVLIAKARIWDATDGIVQGYIGDALWLALAGVVSLLRTARVGRDHAG